VCILKTDIKNYYESINHKILLDKISKLNQPIVYAYVKHYLNAYKQFENKEYGLPCGINFSQILSEYYLIEFDKVISKFCRTNNFYYYRYCDDILVMGLLENQKIKVIVLSELNSLNLSINDKKTFFNESEIFNYLGYIHSNRKISLSIHTHTINKIKGLITARIFKALDYCEKYISLGHLDRLLNFYKYSRIQINRIIKGTNNDWGINPMLAPYGIAPIFSLLNDYKQIYEMESWLGKIVTYYKYSLVDLIKSGNASLYVDQILNNPIKLESLTKWSFMYKKENVKTIIKAILTEAKYPIIYKGSDYTNWIEKDDLKALNMLIHTKTDINRSDMKRALKYFGENNSKSHLTKSTNYIYDADDDIYDYISRDEVSGDPDLLEWWDDKHRFDQMNLDEY